MSGIFKYLLAVNYGVEGLPWWVILLIALGILAVGIIIPWKKIYQHYSTRKKANEKLKIETKSITPETLLADIDPKNTPYWGVYNWFGKKQALRTSKWIYVEEQPDPCPLCCPFENQVLSLEEFEQNATTMSEAISQGYHHLGCHHQDRDYFHGMTQIPQNKWTREQKQTRYHLRLKQYRIEQKLRDLKYTLENKNLKARTEQTLRMEIQTTEQELIAFVQANDLVRNQTRENPTISDWKKFS